MLCHAFVSENSILAVEHHLFQCWAELCECVEWMVFGSWLEKPKENLVAYAVNNAHVKPL